jgi:hypothetical protein
MIDCGLRQILVGGKTPANQDSMWGPMPGYSAFCSIEARKVKEWAKEEPNRIRASKLNRIANKMEELKRGSGT